MVSRDEYPLLYHGRKRAIYEKAVASLAVEPIRPRDAHVNTFVKAEKINFSAKVDPAPRVIQPRSPRYNVEVGRYLKLYEKAMCVAFRRVFGYRVVLKGLNATDVACELRSSWETFTRPVAVGLDATRFDQHVSADALRWEHSVYNDVFRSKELRALLERQIDNRGVGYAEGYKVEYSVTGCRMSGDINTGMGNCLLMSSMVLSFVEHYGIKARLANNGDDCVLMVEQSDLHRLDGLDAWMLDFGFTLTREEPVTTFERIEFCQAQPVYTSTGWRMIRDPRVCLSKDMVSLQGWSSELEVQYWLHLIGSAGKALNKGVPVLEAFYSRLAELGSPAPGAYLDNVGVSGMDYMARGVVGGEVVAESRVSFYRAFGITPDFQEDLEALYSCLVTSYQVSPMMFPDITLDNDNPLTTWLRTTRT